MRKLVFPLAFLVTSTLVACSFQVGSSRPQDPQQPAGNQPPPQPQGQQPQQPGVQPPPAPSRPMKNIGKRKDGSSAGPTPTPSTSGGGGGGGTTPPIPSGAPVVNAQTPFGNGTPTNPGWKGNIYQLPAGTTKLPSLATMQPIGLVFTQSINVTPQPFTTGFPGIANAPKDNFAIRYEGPLEVTTEADYDFRLVADDGANLLIDNTPIIDNDGVKTAPGEKTGPVHLVAGMHVVTVDYMQTTGPVALQLFCKKVGGTEQVCPNKL